jgi:hypothetical protein
MTGDQERYVATRPAFGAWLLQQSTGGFVGELIAAGRADRAFPKSGDAEAVRKRLREMQAPGEYFDAVDEAEADWRAAE